MTAMKKKISCFQLMRLQEAFCVINFWSFFFVLCCVHSFLVGYGHVSLNASWIFFQISLLFPLYWWYVILIPMPFLSFRPPGAEQGFCSFYFNRDILKNFLYHLSKNVEYIECAWGKKEKNKQKSELQWRTGSFCQTRNHSLLL